MVGGAKRAALAEVIHTGRGITKIGRAFPDGDGKTDNQDHAGILGVLCPVLEQAGFTVELPDDIRGAVWDKLLINAVINPLTALLRIPNGRLPELAECLSLMKDLYRGGLQADESGGETDKTHRTSRKVVDFY